MSIGSQQTHHNRFAQEDLDTCYFSTRIAPDYFSVDRLLRAVIDSSKCPDANYHLTNESIGLACKFISENLIAGSGSLLGLQAINCLDQEANSLFKKYEKSKSQVSLELLQESNSVISLPKWLSKSLKISLANSLQAEKSDTSISSGLVNLLFISSHANPKRSERIEKAKRLYEQALSGDQAPQFLEERLGRILTKACKDSTFRKRLGEKLPEFKLITSRLGEGIIRESNFSQSSAKQPPCLFSTSFNIAKELYGSNVEKPFRAERLARMAHLVSARLERADGAEVFAHYIEKMAKKSRILDSVGSSLSRFLPLPQMNKSDAQKYRTLMLLRIKLLEALTIRAHENPLPSPNKIDARNVNQKEDKKEVTVRSGFLLDEQPKVPRLHVSTNKEHIRHDDRSIKRKKLEAEHESVSMAVISENYFKDRSKWYELIRQVAFDQLIKSINSTAAEIARAHEDVRKDQTEMAEKSKTRIEQAAELLAQASNAAFDEAVISSYAQRRFIHELESHARPPSALKLLDLLMIKGRYSKLPKGIEDSEQPGLVRISRGVFSKTSFASLN